MTEEQIKKIEWLNRARLADEDRQVMEAVSEKDEYIRKSLGISDADSKRELKVKAAEVATYREEIKLAIEKIENEQYKKILKMRYLAYMKMDDIADALHKEIRTVQRNHKKAIDAVAITNA